MINNNYRSAKEAAGLFPGDYAPDFTAEDINGEPYSLHRALEKGPVVLIFYRGHWCPICNAHLKKLQSSLSLIYSRGASVAAVSPEKSEFLKRTQEKTHAEFTLLYDKGYKVSDLFDVTFLPDKITRAAYNTVLGAKLKDAHSDDSERLPIPATFIIGRDKKIVWRHFDPDYKKRSSINDILENLPE